MPGQLSSTGAQALANTISGIVPPYIGTAAPAWVPGLTWVNTSVSPPVNYYWNGASWAAGPQQLYLAMLTGDPTQSGPNGGYAVQISDLIEDSQAGYSRQPVSFGAAPGTAAGTYPATVQNTSAITFGPYTDGMTLGDGWGALVTAASGTAGLLLYMWTLPAVQQVGMAQSFVIPAGDLTLTQS